MTWWRGRRSAQTPPISRKHELRRRSSGQHEPEVGLRAGQVEDGERQRDRRHRVPEEGHGPPGEQQPELALGERPEAGAEMLSPAPPRAACPSTASSRHTTARAERPAPTARPRSRRRPRGRACAAATHACSSRSLAALAPLRQLLPDEGEVLGRRLGDAEVDQRQPLGLAALDLLEGAEPGLDVDVGRRRDRHHVAARLNPHACGVARVERSVPVQVADVMEAWPGDGKHAEAEDALADDLDVLLRNRRELTPERVEGVAVQPPRAAFEPARVDDVRSTDLRDVDPERRVLRGRACRRRPRGRGGCARAAGAGCR